MRRVAVSGSASAIHASWRAPIDNLVYEVVTQALHGCRLQLDDIDTVVTVASDILDGVLVPVRAEIAGNLGRAYSHITSSAGHALGAAAAMIESGQAERVLLVGWGAAEKFGAFDPRILQADPFLARPVGALPDAVAAIQSQQLLDLDLLDPETLTKHATCMARRAWPAREEPIRTMAPNPCDGAVAIILEHGERSGVAVKDFASVSRAYSPHDEVLDPATWVREAVSLLKAETRPIPRCVEVAGPTLLGELRALEAIAADDGTPRNESGGGASAWFGPATGLRQIAFAAQALAGHPEGSIAIAADLSGPLSQHVTVAVLERSGAP
jgi:acetyl-CoA acetyltransferase